ncbi:amidohydrolase family protein [Ectothiorhodospiraceae bacterium 2226]|nr:amidohydrolase family protein [Ectothiorhodospiraceae bacterium 2226]
MLFILLCAFVGTAAAHEPLALTGVTLIDGRGGPPQADMTVVVRDGRIAAIGPRHEVQLEPDLQRFALDGHHVLPGLIDAHVHFFQSGGIYTRPDILDLRHQRSYRDEQAAVRQRLNETLRRYTASGVTGVVDLGGPAWNVELRETAAEAPDAPDLAVAGPLLTSRVPPELLAADQQPMVEVGTAEEARQAVRAQVALDVDFLKLWLVAEDADAVRATDGWIRAAIDAAHEADLRVVAHATRLEVARAVVEAGADILAHGVDDQPVDEGFLNLLVQREVIYIPTLAVEQGYRRALSHTLTFDTMELRLGDPEVIEGLRLLPALGAPRVDPAPGARREIMYENLRRAHAAGVRLAAGSDAGNIGTLHGPALHREMRLMVAAGLPPEAVIQAATAGGAAVLGRADVGTLTVGQRANLIILLCERNPLESIDQTRQILRVMKDGRLFTPAQLIPSGQAATS